MNIRYNTIRFRREKVQDVYAHWGAVGSYVITIIIYWPLYLLLTLLQFMRMLVSCSLWKQLVTNILCTMILSWWFIRCAI